MKTMIQISNHEMCHFGYQNKIQLQAGPHVCLYPRRPTTSWHLYTWSHQSPRRSKLTRTSKHHVDHLLTWRPAKRSRDFNTVIRKQNRLWKVNICRHQLCQTIYVVNLYWIETSLYMLNDSSDMITKAHRSVTGTRILYITMLNLWTEHVVCKRLGI